MTTVIDTNVLRAADILGHPRHDEALDALADAVPPLIIPAVVLSEILVDLDQPSWDSYLQGLTADGFEIAAFDLRATARARQESFAVPPRLRLPDASVLATARVVGASAVATFDEALRRAAQQDGFAALPAVAAE
ncbi:MAG: PIN domain-containing protein [Propionicimonas sp.]|nr:PIN domain-containing protein [Propionicimonas sp.]